jgi:thiol:disulfide interchange protein
MLKLLILALSLALPAAIQAADTFGAPAQQGAIVLEGGGSRFLPVARAYPLLAGIRDDQLVFSWEISPGYYLYRERLRFELRDAAGSTPIDVALPPGLPYEDAFFGKTEVYRDALEISLPRPADDSQLVAVRSQGCADAGLCYPPRTQLFRIDSAGTAVFEVSAEDDAPAADAPAAPTPRQHASAGELLWMALLAALGGLILNLMPCVFPVLSLKVLSIAGKGGDGGGKAMHGLSYAAGVVLSFVAVAALLIALRSAGAAIGWGFHLQSPVFVAALGYLFVVMGLSLSGMINPGSGMMGMGDALTQRSGYTGSFFTGVLATVVASPCSAPFMGTALGFAMTQPTAASLAIFAALGLGMAAPFVLLTLSPALLRRLPRPGPWMDGFKQFLAFPLYAAAVWLLWVLGKQSGVNAMAVVTAGCVLLALGLWCRERALLHRRPLATRMLGTAICLLALLPLASPLLDPQSRQPDSSSANWETYSAERLEQLRRQGEPVLVNVTADWCITCLANEKIALDTDTVRQALRERGIHYLKGDWTNSDPRLTALLQQHGRNGVPLYLYYPRGQQNGPRLLPQLLTPTIVLEAIDESGV